MRGEGRVLGFAVSVEQDRTYVIHVTSECFGQPYADAMTLKGKLPDETDLRDWRDITHAVLDDYFTTQRARYYTRAKRDSVAGALQDTSAHLLGPGSELSLGGGK